MHATKAAVEEGVLPGGGVALLYGIKALDGLTPANNDQKVGVDIIRRALQAPARQIAENAGSDGAVVAGKLLEQTDDNFGYDAQTGTYGELVKAGISRPTKVVNLALQDAESLQALLIPSAALVTTRPQKHGSAAGGTRRGM